MELDSQEIQLRYIDTHKSIYKRAPKFIFHPLYLDREHDQKGLNDIVKEYNRCVEHSANTELNMIYRSMIMPGSMNKNTVAEHFQNEHAVVLAIYSSRSSDIEQLDPVDLVGAVFVSTERIGILSGKALIYSKPMIFIPIRSKSWMTELIECLYSYGIALSSNRVVISQIEYAFPVYRIANSDDRFDYHPGNIHHPAPRIHSYALGRYLDTITTINPNPNPFDNITFSELKATDISRMSDEDFAIFYMAETSFTKDLAASLNVPISEVEKVFDYKTKLSTAVNFYFLKSRVFCLRDRISSKLIGIVSGTIGSSSHDSVRIDYLYIDPAFRRHGYGAYLLKCMESILIETGYDNYPAAVLTAYHNEDSIQFYKKFGYKIICTKVRYPVPQKFRFQPRMVR